MRSTRARAERAGAKAVPARPDDYGREFLDKILAVRVVTASTRALDHVARFGSRHTEAILHADLGARAAVRREVDATRVW